MRDPATIRTRIEMLEIAKATFLCPPRFVHHSDPSSLTDADWKHIWEASGEPGAIVDMPAGTELKELRPSVTLESLNAELAALRWVLDDGDEGTT